MPKIWTSHKRMENPDHGLRVIPVTALTATLPIIDLGEILMKGNDKQERSSKILIADDSESSRDLLRYILERTGCEVIEAKDGEEAPTRASSIVPDLLILDLNMPGMDGYSVASELRKLPAFAQTPIIALSAGVSHVDPAKLAASGFSTFLPKPIPPAKVRECVAMFLGNADAR